MTASATRLRLEDPATGGVDRSPATRRSFAGRLADEFDARLTGRPVWVLLIEVFIGLGWARATVEKAIDPSWWAGDQIGVFLESHAALPWFQPFLDLFVSPWHPAVALAVLVLEAVVGVLLLSGRQVGKALAVGMGLNLVFIAAGAVTPSVFYLLAQGAVALWLAENSLSSQTAHTLGLLGMSGAVLAGMCLPFVRTLAPAEVIHDPALMLITTGLLTAVTCDLVAHRAASPLD